MNKFGVILLSAAFVFGSGFFKKSEDGSYSIDTSAAEKQANEAIDKANTEADKYAKKAEDLSASAIEKIKTAAAEINVPKEEILADLDKNLEAIQTKAAAMDPAKLVAYLNQYNTVFEDAQAKVADYSQQAKELKWSEKFSAKGKEVSASLAKYTDQFNGLKEHATVYLNKLKSFGVDPAAFGFDLSAYGL